MSGYISDVNTRQLLFDDFQADLERTATPGIREIIGDEVVRLMKNAIPVGLDHDRRVVMPDDYDMTQTPAVLMLRPGEPATFDAGPAEYEAGIQAAYHYGLEVEHNPEEYVTALHPTMRASVLPITIETDEHETESRILATLPALMIVGTGLDSSRSGLQTFIGGHEFRHWYDLIVQPDGHDGCEGAVELEKAAYYPGMELAKELGWTDQIALPDAKQLAERAVGLPPEEGAHNVKSAMRAARLRNQYDSIQDLYIHASSIAATALTMAYGDTHSPAATHDEGDAYRNYGLSAR